ncbi:MAG: hypothetical protein GF416_07220 [Candidatus Altiarchaeales archaeon]|nr:hypothetical protein [Candidatus Altiarchaeales archaeon]MBD3416902.1 hypothetical protein [Candidatus Altiarchaeales archaeon]
MRWAAALIVLMILGSASSETGEYNIIVEENGNALVLIGLEGEGVVDIPLPLDVSYPQVFNAMYVESADGIEVSLPGNESVTVAYQTSMITSKTGMEWSLDMVLGGIYKATVALPKNALVKSAAPKAGHSETPESKNIVWDSADNIRVTYDFASAQVTPTTMEPTTTTLGATTTTVKATSTTQPVEEGGSFTGYVMIGFAVLLVGVLLAAGAYFTFLKRRGPTDGMRKVMRTLSGNEYKIVDTLLKNRNGMRRSDLERTAGLSKSSLALALNSLERKNIVEVDRTYTTHYVEVTKWFKGL